MEFISIASDPLSIEGRQQQDTEHFANLFVVILVGVVVFVAVTVYLHFVIKEAVAAGLSMDRKRQQRKAQRA